jgi:hypothetical protein
MGARDPKPKQRTRKQQKVTSVLRTARCLRELSQSQPEDPWKQEDSVLHLSSCFLPFTASERHHFFSSCIMLKHPLKVAKALLSERVNPINHQKGKHAAEITKQRTIW